jgi:predicted TIM-barrel fold metal-dependent hydrolase
MPVVFHIGGARLSPMWPGYDTESRLFKSSINAFLGNSDCITDLITSGICHRFPKVDFVSVESGIGFLPYLLESMDWQWLNLHLHRNHPELDLLPSEYFKRQIYGSFWFEDTCATRVLDLIPDNVFYETDFPHPTSITPGVFPFSQTARENIQKLEGLPEDLVRKVLQDNAARVYHVDV